MGATGPSRPVSRWRLFDWLVSASVGQAPRRLDGGWIGGTVTLACVALVVLYWYFAGFGYFSPETFVTFYLGFTLVLIFMLYGATSRSPRDRITVLDGVLVLATIAATAHYSIYYPIRFVERWGEPLGHDIVFGAITVLLMLEACRRVLGMFLPGLCLSLIAYAILGPWFPGILAHPGIAPWELVGWLYSSEAIYGSITRVFASFVFLFIVFGATLEQSGGRHLFINLPLSFLGWLKGGPAKVSIVASALFGMISGSAAANVVTTGAFTIPLMKRAGFPPYVAGAFEATASTIGITMPPLMGAAIFIMSDFTGIPYFEIVKVSILPALLFILSLLLVAGAYAHKHGIGGLPREELGDPWHILKTYWAFAIPIVLVVGLLVAGYSPDYAVFIALPSVIVASLFSRETRLTARRWVQILDTGARRSVTVGGLAGALGIIIGVVVKTGISAKLSHVVIDLSGGELLIGIVLTALVTFFLGMGISSVTADYILLSVLIAPALIDLGASMMAAHLLLIWYTQTSNLTPPVCTVAFAAAAQAGAPPWKTGFFAFRIGLFIYLIPIAFVFGNLLDLDDTWGVARAAVTTALAAWCFSGVIVGYLAGVLSVWQRLVLGVAMVSLFEPGLYLDLVGVALLLAVLLWQRARRRV